MTQHVHHYQEDQLFETPVKFDATDDYPEDILYWFNNSTLMGDTNKEYVYYSSGKTPYFLCTNWAAWRIKHSIHMGGHTPRDSSATPIDSTTINVRDARDQRQLLSAMGLQDPKDKTKGKFLVVECQANDPERMLILWSKVQPPPKGGKLYDPDHEIIAHVSVRPDDRLKPGDRKALWESKVSVAPIVLLHDENLYRDFYDGLNEGERLRPALYYKRAE